MEYIGPSPEDIEGNLSEEKESPEVTPEQVQRAVNLAKKFASEIRKKIEDNPDIEIGGTFSEDGIDWYPIESSSSHSVEGGLKIEVRKDALEHHVVHFHTHPKAEFLEPSANDIITAAHSLLEIIYSMNSIILAYPEKILPLDEISEADDEEWERARYQQEGVDSDEEAYWGYMNNLKKRLGINVLKIE